MGNRQGMGVAGLFSGIGGFEAAFEAAGFRNILLCEIDPAAKCVLAKRFPNCQLISDVKEISELPSDVNVLCAGFPCQDLSSVGQKEGIAGTRSSLISEVFRILEKKPVEWVVIENVAFMLRLKKGQAIKYITSQLSNLGYKWAYRTVDSAAFVPQRRERVFIVASLHDDPRNVLLCDDFGYSRFAYGDYDKPASLPVGFYWTEGRFSIGTALNAIPALKAGSTIGIPASPAIAFTDGLIATPNIKDAERLQGFTADWTLPAVEYTKSSCRWRLVGNAVTVDVVTWIANRIKTPGLYISDKDERIKSTDSWPTAAWGANGEIRISNASKWPFENRNGGLDSFLQYPVKPLSKKAIRGFIKRVNEGGLKTPSGFIDSLAMYEKSLEEKGNG